MSVRFKCEACQKEQVGVNNGGEGWYKPKGWYALMDKYQNVNHACSKECEFKLKKKGMEKIYKTY